MNNRLDYIDVMRGIAILLVILEHCIAHLNNDLARVVLSFHMPLFFFISGLCIKPNMGGGKKLYRQEGKKHFNTTINIGYNSNSNSIRSRGFVSSCAYMETN